VQTDHYESESKIDMEESLKPPNQGCYKRLISSTLASLNNTPNRSKLSTKTDLEQKQVPQEIDAYS